MKKILFCAALLSFSISALAGQKAVTERGEEVLLKDDGTWSYINDNADLEVSRSEKVLVKPESASFLVKSAKNRSAYWIDPKRWNFFKPKNNSDAEYEFQMKGEDLYGIVITEAAHIPLESLTRIALENAKNIAPNMSVLKKEYRQVNGNEVIYMEMSGNMQGIDFTYFGYYHSDQNGATQFIAYTANNLIDKYRENIAKFLNGFVLQADKSDTAQ